VVLVALVLQGLPNNIKDPSQLGGVYATLTTREMDHTFPIPTE